MHDIWQLTSFWKILFGLWLCTDCRKIGFPFSYHCWCWFTFCTLPIVVSVQAIPQEWVASALWQLIKQKQPLMTTFKNTDIAICLSPLPYQTRRKPPNVLRHLERYSVLAGSCQKAIQSPFAVAYGTIPILALILPSGRSGSKQLRGPR